MLGRLVIATSYDKGHTKTKRTRYMPVHPTLAALLAEWKLRGWPEMMGRSPTPEDLVVPMPRPTNRGPRVEFGGMRTDHHSYKRQVKDMETLGLRHRRGHERTSLSSALTLRARAATPSTSVSRHVAAALEALEGGNPARAATLLRILLS